ncbi:MAG TPA: cellulase family glycosylhydrolase, partial [Thermomicrobiaceae bacterium]|nr:cellulase family glycosylhydrolase [Thermomicrobiaceae bacterium]
SWLERRFHRLIRVRSFIVGIHLLVILALLGAIGAAIFFNGYFNRGVAESADLTPVANTSVNPVGANTFLNEEVDPAKVERSLQMLKAAGVGYIRQIFPWNDLEPARNSYVSPTTGQSTWLKYDRIVNDANALGIQVIARLDKPPAWARAGQANVKQFPDGPPDNNADYANFVATFVKHYQGKVHYIQIWNEPNLQDEWGGLPIDPAAFTKLLKAAYIAAKKADPSITVLMPGLAPTDQTGPTNLSDLLFLKGMYKAGAKNYFDIGVAMVYGYGYSPYDRRVSPTRDNFSRVIQTHDIMVANGDASKPVWAAEYGWVSLPKNWTGNPSVWGQPVSLQTQAKYLAQGYIRAQQEWPWMGVMCLWYFRDPYPLNSSANNAKDPTNGFTLVNYNFSPTPAWTLLSSLHTLLDRAWTGAYTASSAFLQHGADWQLSGSGSQAVLQPQRAGATVTIPFAGPRLDLDLSGSGSGYLVSIDGKAAKGLSRNQDGQSILQAPGRTTIASGLSDGAHTAVLTALGSGSGALGITGFTVVRIPTSAWIFSWYYGILAFFLLLNVLSLVWVWRDERFRLTFLTREPPAQLPAGSRVFSPAQLREARTLPIAPRSRRRRFPIRWRAGVGPIPVDPFGTIRPDRLPGLAARPPEGVVGPPAPGLPEPFRARIIGPLLPDISQPLPEPEGGRERIILPDISQPELPATTQTSESGAADAAKERELPEGQGQGRSSPEAQSQPQDEIY